MHTGERDSRRGKSMKRRLAAAAIIAFSAGSAWADPAITISPTFMRAEPDSRAAIVQVIPANAEIDVSDCATVWCAASWRRLAGYVRMSALSFDEGVAPSPDPPSYGYPAPGPDVGEGGNPWDPSNAVPPQGHR